MQQQFIQPETNVTPTQIVAPQTETAMAPALSAANTKMPAEIRRQAHRRYRLSRTLKPFFIISSLAYIVSSFSLLSHSHHFPAELRMFVILLFLGTMNAFNAVNAQWRKTMDKLIAQADVQTVGAAVEGLTIKSKARSMRELLTKMLPRLRNSDAYLLNGEQRAILNQALSKRAFYNRRAHTAFLCAILKAYEQVGDTEAVPFVERLARGEGYAAKDKSVQTAAQECLVYLYERAENETYRQNLLRASHAESAAPETLLRPSISAGITAPNELLRPK